MYAKLARNIHRGASLAVAAGKEARLEVWRRGWISAIPSIVKPLKHERSLSLYTFVASRLRTMRESHVLRD
jgi:hypothetical protein